MKKISEENNYKDKIRTFTYVKCKKRENWVPQEKMKW